MTIGLSLSADGDQEPKRPFTVEELAERGLTKVAFFSDD
jgi:hypothetical protein